MSFFDMLTMMSVISATFTFDTKASPKTGRKHSVARLLNNPLSWSSNIALTLALTISSSTGPALTDV